MKTARIFLVMAGWLATRSFTTAAAEVASATPPRVPAFSVDYLDHSVSPATNLYQFANGQWLKNNPVPADKSRWSAFTELAERNWYLLHQILEDTASQAAALPAHSPRRQVGDFYIATMDTNRIEKLGIKPIAADLQRIDGIKSTQDLFKLLGDFHQRGISGVFAVGFGVDDKDSSTYAIELNQGGISLPDRDYYLKDSFADHLKLYRAHVQKMFELLGEKTTEAAARAATVTTIETELARASRSRVDLRDPNKNYHKFTGGELAAGMPAILWNLYFEARGITSPAYEIVGQPEFFAAVNQLVTARPLSDWQVYLRWHLVHRYASFLPVAFANESFNFYGKTLSDQPEQEPRWKRAAKVVDDCLGESLGQLYVEKYFPPAAKARMNELVENLKAVFHDRLQNVPWMTETTRAKALDKFTRFTQKIGCPDQFRDYSQLDIRRDDLLGNLRRAAEFESRRHIARLGKAVDRAEWHMTPETVNAYFNPQQNEIVFPAGILQPPFFDVAMDDAVNYGGIGVVIGHEITHGYDDQGRKYDADGNLHDWWSDADAKEFDTRAQLMVDEFNAFEALPGLPVNGKLTLGENLADLGGVNISYEALQRALAKNPATRKKIGGFTPEQRFFISFAQVWRTNIRAAEAQRLILVDPHSPGQFRAYGPLLNFPPFYDAFEIPAGSPMWRAPEQRVKVW